jgi:hypothetical protein
MGTADSERNKTRKTKKHLVRFFSTTFSLVLLTAVAAGLTSCGKSNSAGSGGNASAAGQASGIDRAAQDAAFTRDWRC